MSTEIVTKGNKIAIATNSEMTKTMVHIQEGTYSITAFEEMVQKVREHEQFLEKIKVKDIKFGNTEDHRVSDSFRVIDDELVHLVECKEEGFTTILHTCLEIKENVPITDSSFSITPTVFELRDMLDYRVCKLKRLPIKDELFSIHDLRVNKIYPVRVIDNKIQHEEEWLKTADPETLRVSLIPVIKRTAVPNNHKKDQATEDGEHPSNHRNHDPSISSVFRVDYRDNKTETHLFCYSCHDTVVSFESDLVVQINATLDEVKSLDSSKIPTVRELEMMLGKKLQLMSGNKQVSGAALYTNGIFFIYDPMMNMIKTIAIVDGCSKPMDISVSEADLMLVKTRYPNTKSI